VGGAHPTPYYCGYPNVVGRVGGRVDRLRWRGSEFRLQAAQDRVNAELQTDETSRVTAEADGGPCLYYSLLPFETIVSVLSPSKRWAEPTLLLRSYLLTFLFQRRFCGWAFQPPVNARAASAVLESQERCSEGAVP